MSIADKLQTIAENESKVFEAGKKAEYNLFWDIFQLNGERRWYWGAFAGPGWTDKTFKPKYPIIMQGTCGYCFRTSQITHIPRIELLETKVLQIFYDASKVHTIDCFALPNGSVSFTNTFSNCINLENITIEGEIGGNGFDVKQSTKLTHDSLMSIINALKDFSTPQNVLQNDPLTLTDYTPSIMDIYELVEGKTYITNYWTEETDTFFDNVEQKAHKVYVEGYGEKIGVHYSADYWVYPDDYTFNLIIFNGDIDEGTGEPFIQEYRYLQNKATGEITLMGTERNGDKISVYTKAGDGSHTITLGTENLAKLTDAEKEQAIEKGWVLE